jgi:hypothetical protein
LNALHCDARSSIRKQITASDSTGHHIHIEEPQLVIQAIREVVGAVH